MKGQYRLLEEKVQAAGRAADAKADPASLNYLADVSRQALEEAGMEQENFLENRKLDIKSKEIDEKTKIELQKLSLKAQEIKQRQESDKTKKYVAGINKN